jgi:uncharacterized membrane protein YbhN (UPF0104 family)
MPLDRSRTLVVVGAVLALAGIAVPAALGVTLHVSGLLEAALGAALLVASSALALNGSRPTPLPAQRAVPAVLATTAANAVTPAGIGGALLVVRFHRRSGLSPEQAVAAAGARSIVGGLVASLATLLATLAVGNHVGPASGAITWAVPAMLLTLVLGAMAVPAARRRVARFGGALLDIARSPRCLVSLLVGCAGVTLAQLLTLHGAVVAVGGQLSWASLLAALMGSAAARSAVPSPGGVGPIEAALVGGLSALGLGVGTAAAAVAVYRTAGHWVPVLGGVASIKSLRRAQLV